MQGQWLEMMVLDMRERELSIIKFLKLDMLLLKMMLRLGLTHVLIEELLMRRGLEKEPR